jgi:DNA-binding NarL/FixJ family response regulator
MRVLMYEEACVLIYGKEPSLLETRRQILRQGGFEVVAVSKSSEFAELPAQAFHVLVLCHTLNPKEQQEAIAAIQRANPVLQTIIMTAYAPEFKAEATSRFLSAYDGPEALILWVRKAVERSGDGAVWLSNEGERTVNMPLRNDKEQLSRGWMFTGHADQTVRTVNSEQDTVRLKA